MGETFPDQDGFHKSTGRMWYRLASPLPDDPALHAAVLVFFSDMTRTVLAHAEGRGLLRGTMHTLEGKLGLSMVQEMVILPLESRSEA